MATCDKCERPGKLVQQFACRYKEHVWVQRSYLCRFHLAAANRWSANTPPWLFRKLAPIEFVNDQTLLEKIS